MNLFPIGPVGGELGNGGVQLDLTREVSDLFGELQSLLVGSGRCLCGGPLHPVRLHRDRQLSSPAGGTSRATIDVDPAGVCEMARAFARYLLDARTENWPPLGWTCRVDQQAAQRGPRFQAGAAAAGPLESRRRWRLASCADAH